MARRKDKEADKSPPDQVSLKIERTIHRKLKMLAAAKDQDLTEYVDLVLRQHVDAEFPRFLRDQS